MGRSSVTIDKMATLGPSALSEMEKKKLTTSRVGNLTRSIHTLLYVMTIHIYTYCTYGECEKRGAQPLVSGDTCKGSTHTGTTSRTAGPVASDSRQ